MVFMAGIMSIDITSEANHYQASLRRHDVLVISTQVTSLNDLTVVVD